MRLLPDLTFTWMSSGTGIKILVLYFLISISLIHASDIVQISKTNSSDLGCPIKGKICDWTGVTSWKWKYNANYDLNLTAPLQWSNYVLEANMSTSFSKSYTLLSPKFNLISPNGCFKFYYYFIIDSSSKNQLSITLNDFNHNSKEMIWARSGINADQWHFGEAHIDKAGTYTIKIDATGYDGFMAIRELQLSGEKCSTSNLCDFESGNCSFTTSGRPPNYVFHFGNANNVMGKVKTDHTSRTQYGQVAYVSKGSVKSVAELYSPKMTGLQLQCLTFWFLRTGMGVQLSVMKETSDNVRMIVFESNKTHLMNEWIRGQVDVRITDTAQLVFEARMIDTSDSDLEIDDISIKPFSCPMPVDCYFSSDFCGWKEEITTNQLLWAIGPGRVRDPSKLAVKQMISPYRSVLYTDFTLIKSKSSMELLSEFVNSASLGSACFGMRFAVKKINLDTDSFVLTRIDFNGQRTVIWSLKKNETSNTYWQNLMIEVPNPPKNVPYRMSLKATSANADTYLGIREVLYTTNLYECNSNKETTPPTSTTTTAKPSSLTLNCNFESDLCSWKSITPLGFTRATPMSTNMKSMSPFMDHTYSSKMGHFVYISNNRSNIDVNGGIQAVNPFINDAHSCLFFYYYFYATGPSNFTLTMDGKQSSKTIFHAYGAVENRWRPSLIQLSSTSSYNTFTFHASLKNGFLAIDDIKAYSGDCQSTSNYKDRLCDFELDTTCIFEPVYNNLFFRYWDVHSASKVGFPDHTTNSLNGNYYGINFKSVSLGGSGPFLVQSLQVSGIRCVHFAYLLYNVNPTTTLFYEIINHHTSSNSITTKIRWEVSGSTELRWFMHRIPIKSLKFDIKFGIETKNENDGFVFIDDVFFDTKNCIEQYGCDFEGGNMCEMEPVSPGTIRLSKFIKKFFSNKANFSTITFHYINSFCDITWLVFSPQQSDNYIQHDYNFRNRMGKYLLMVPNDSYDRAIFITERFKLADYNGKICFKLAIYKPSIQSVLEVYQGESSDDRYYTKIWDFRLSNHDWQLFEILAYPRNSSSKDIFFAIVGTVADVSTYIAVDDIQVKSDCTHPSNIVSTPKPTGPTMATIGTTSDPFLFTCTNGDKINLNQVCDWHKDCSHGEDEKDCGICMFRNHDLCRYTINNEPNSIKFTFRDQVTIGPDTGFDFSNNFMIATGGAGKATLTSPFIHQSYLLCSMDFSYNFNTTKNFYDSKASALIVYVELIDISRRTIIWESTFERLSKGYWSSISLALKRIRHRFRVVFQAGNSILDPHEYHAIGNIDMDDCEPGTPSSSCPSTYFTCKNKVCVDLSYVCDFEDDCGDQSDEMNCNSTLITSFENGYGYWGTTLKKQWKIVASTNYDSLRSGPTYDHTSGFDGGLFLYVNGGFYLNEPTTTAEIDSLPFYAPYGCRIRFYLFKNSANSTLFVSLLSTVTGRKIKLVEIVDNSYKWMRYSLALSGYSSKLAPYRLIFNGILNSTKDHFVTPYIAIDDISFTEECNLIDGDFVPTSSDHSTLTTPKSDNCPTVECLDKMGKKICLKVNQFCDFVEDCKDGTDEKTCGNCDFNKGQMCEWKNHGTESSWNIIAQAYTSSGSLPKVDANNSSYGGYIAVEAPSSHIYFRYSHLRSPLINGKTSKYCKLQFSFMSVGGAYVSIRLEKNSGTEDIFDIVNQRITHWTSYSADIGEQIGGFNIKILGASRTEYNKFEDVSIDNVQLVDCNPYLPPPTTNPNVTDTISCSFENDLCSWEVIGITQRSSWLRTDNPYREPGNDHTSMIIPRPRYYGQWLTTTVSNTNYINVPNYLVTTIQLKAGKTYCFSFWYYFLGINTHSFLGLYASKSGKAASNPNSDPDYQPLWNTIVPEGRNWYQRYVEINPQTNDFYLVMVANVDQLTIIGLDDFHFAEGTCGTIDPEFCDFEVNNCDWNMKNGEWHRNSLKFTDHSTRTTNGHFAMDDDTGRTVTMTKPMSTMPIFKRIPFLPIQTFCLRFFYYMNTDFVNKQIQDSTSFLTVRYGTGSFYSDTKNISILDAYNGGTFQEWSMFQLKIRARKSDQIMLTGHQSASMTKLYIDDISVRHGECYSDGECDFENDMCGWFNPFVSDNGKRILWMRIAPNSHYIKGTLMHYDKTLLSKNGHYLVMPSMMQEDAYGTIRSQIMKHTTDVNFSQICFRMYYFAKARNSSVIAFKLRMFDLSRKKSTSFSVNATISLSWIRYEAEFDNVPSTYQFQIETGNTLGLISDIGIDDINIKMGKCQSSHLTTTTPVPIIEKKLDCDFDYQTCNWKYDNSIWIKGNYQTQNDKYAPTRDHTTETSSGRYLMFHQPSNTNTNTFSIESSVNLTYTGDHCLTMWYYEDGENQFSFTLYMGLPTFSIVGYRMVSKIENRRRWNLIRANFFYSPGYNISSVALKMHYSPSVERQQQFSIFAIDDIMVRPGQCKHNHDYIYTFENGMEDLEVEYIQPVRNSIGTLFTPKYDHQTGTPSVDHTINSDAGIFFLFMNLKLFAPTTYMDTLSIIDVPRQNQMEYVCVRFAYQMVGNVTLRLYTIPKDDYSGNYIRKPPLWQSRYSTTSWTMMEVNIKPSYDYKVTFYMEKTMDKTSFAALDDLSVLGHKCQQLGDCDFDNGKICSYTPLTDKSTGSYNWGVFTAPAMDKNWPGPQYDYTTQHIGGGYLYLTGFRSKFTSPIISKVISGPKSIKSTSSYCLSAYTQLTTNDLTLKFSIVRSGNTWTDSNRNLLLATMKSRQAKWSAFNVTIDSSVLVNAAEIQVLIEGQLLANSKGLIAIDGITITEGQCSSGGILCENGIYLTNDRICNFINDCPSGMDEINCGNCDFEQGTCGWVNVTNFSEEWLLTNHDESGNTLAPNFDGSGKNKGHFLLMSRPMFRFNTYEGRPADAEAALNYKKTGMYLKNAYKSCVMHFDYYIKSPTNYTLDVRMGTDSSEWSTIYRIQKLSENGWRKANAHIGTHLDDFMVDLRGHLNDGHHGVVAVDNIKFINCSLPTPLPANKNCNDGQFMCTKYRFCINNDDVCDFSDDCGDGSDETGCRSYPNCNFEYSFMTCGIETDDMIDDTGSTGSNVEWNFQRGKYAKLYEPTIDNTERTEIGSYVVLAKPRFSSSKHTNSNSADFYGPMLTSSSQTLKGCRMRFFYFINGEPTTISNTYLDIYVRYSNKLEPERKPILRLKLNINDDLQQRWNKAIIEFKSSQAFQFVFRGTVGTNDSRIAVDDITYNNNCIASSIKPMTTTKNPTVITTLSTSTTDNTPVTTKKPEVNKKSNSGAGGKIAAGILVPLFLVLGMIGSYFGYKKYRQSRLAQDQIALSMSGIQEDTDY